MRAGDKVAFGDLVDRHIAHAYAVAERLVRHREDAEDVVQDAFATALDRIDSFDATRAFRPWLTRIVVNRAIDMVRSRSRRAMQSLDEQLVDDAPSPMDDAHGRELLERLRHGMLKLSPRRRLILELHEIEGWPVASIAAKIGASAGTIRWHLHLGRHALRSMLNAFRSDG